MKHGILILSALLFPGFAGAAVEHEENICLSRPVERVHDWLVNYRNYMNLDDRLRRTLTVEIPNPITGEAVRMNMDLQLANMVQSSIFTGFRNDAAGTEGRVWVMLRPYNVSTPALYPRFLIHCASRWNDPAQHVSFEHRCDIVSGNRPAAGAPITVHHNFGLSGFESRVSVTSEPAAVAQRGCSAGQSALHYWFRLTPNAAEVSQIKDAALMGADRFETVRDFVREIFGENGDPFFNWYYQEFYRVWAAGIPAE